jgi:hypothetical protein
MPLADDLCGSREMSPPRQRKPPAQVAGTERKFSWATQRITELTHELEKAQKQVKVRVGLNLYTDQGC